MQGRMKISHYSSIRCLILPLTLSMRTANLAADTIETLINTHSNGDHCYGNQLLGGADIIPSTASAEVMNDIPTGMLPQSRENSLALGEVGEYFFHIFGQFQFAKIRQHPPTRLFENRLDLQVGQKSVTLLEVGQAHTKGDVLV